MRFALGLPRFARRWMRGREKAVKAVSAAAKKEEKRKRIMAIEIEAHKKKVILCLFSILFYS